LHNDGQTVNGFRLHLQPTTLLKLQQQQRLVYLQGASPLARAESEVCLFVNRQKSSETAGKPIAALMKEVMKGISI
jgi:hypothetical protein